MRAVPPAPIKPNRAAAARQCTFRYEMSTSPSLRLCLSIVVVCSACCGSSDMEEQLRVLGKQVTALLDNRKEDVRSIEDYMMRKLTKSQEFEDFKGEIESLRTEIEQLRSGKLPAPPPPPPAQRSTQATNDHLTMDWLSNAVAEIKTEMSEMQDAMNATVILQNHEQVTAEMSLLRVDVANLNAELELARNKNFKYEAALLEIREELGSLRDRSTATAVTCGKTKNQLKAAQLEWNFNWKSLTEKNSGVSFETPRDQHPSRHQRLLRKHVLDLDKASRHLRRTNERLQNKVARLEEEMQVLQNNVKIDERKLEYDRINGNDVDQFLRERKINEIKAGDELATRLVDLEEQQKINADVLLNLTSQLTNFDKLHMSMLELLENVESIENKVNKNFPEFRTEISKLEVQMSEAVAKVSVLKEDQANARVAADAVGVAVSNLNGKVDLDHEKLCEVYDDVEVLKTAASTQNLKLHDHIFKSESSSVELNATKSTIHLVQELKSFEKEYKNIVNKLPYDCTSVNGPSGVYLISPGEGEPIMAYCSDGWTTVQKRRDGLVNFNRNWNDYSNGFGSATGDHWLGNRNLHALTKNNCTKLQINMKDIYGKYWQAGYDDFRVADYSAGFKLTVGSYSGNASDALDYQNRMEFSTIDNDRDISNTHCASNYEGGWWFSHCQHANLNGRYNLGLTWFDSSRNEWIAVSNSEMRIKRRDVC